MSLQRRLQLLDCGTEAPWLDGAARVAFATSDKRHVDQHFGSAKSFAVYALDGERSCLVEVSEFGQQDMDGNEDKLVAKIEALAGCAAVYTQAVGASAIRQLTQQGIRPIKVAPGAEIGELLKGLQQEWRQGPPAWLSRPKAETPPDAMRFARMEAEGWEE